MIRLSLGNVGSGKTASEVREMFLNVSKRDTYTNITTKDMPHVHQLMPEMIIKKTQVDTKRRKSGEIEAVYDFTLNVDFWKGLKDPINVVLDEAHSILNSRRSMSKINIIITDWISLIRRVLGQTEAGAGELVLVTQLQGRIDTIARQMAHQVRYHTCHYMKSCMGCKVQWQENSEMPEGLWACPRCKSYNIMKHSHKIEVKKFASMQEFDMWKSYGMKTWYERYLITDIEDFFDLYNTLQWDNMFSSYYS